jgi:hypothetical protein
MKNTKKIILLFTTFFILSCSKNDEVTDDLQTQINTLEATIKTLESTINTLTSNLSTTSSSNATLTNELAAAQIALTEAKNLADAATTDIDALQASLLIVNETLTAIDYSETVSLDAIGSLVDQSPMQAKKTIYGKWDLGTPPNSSKSSARLTGCEFDFIEFMDDDYLLGIYVAEDDETVIVFGGYDMIVNNAGKVERVHLTYDAGDTSVDIAILTNIVVTETNGSLSASFDVELSLPEALEVCEASLPGSVVAPKEEPLPEASTANAVSNHAKIIGEWEIIKYDETIVAAGPNGKTYTNSLDDLLAGLCEEDASDDQYDKSSSNPNKFRTSAKSEDCEVPVRAILNISNFGTYSVTFLRANGSVVGNFVEMWEWVNSDQTILHLGESEDYDILELNDINFTMTSTFYDYDELPDGTSSDITITETLYFAKIK